MKKVGVPKKKKIVKITKEIQEKLKKLTKRFEDRCVQQFTFSDPQGMFFGVGFLKEAQEHLAKDINTVLLYGVNYNFDGTDIDVKINLEITTDELLKMAKIIGLAIKSYEAEIGGKADIFLEELKLMAKMDKQVAFKVEE